MSASSVDIAFALSGSERKTAPSANASVSSTLRASVDSIVFSIAAHSCSSLYDRFRFAAADRDVAVAVAAVAVVAVDDVEAAGVVVGLVAAAARRCWSKRE